jgi:hypothetical protein
LSSLLISSHPTDEAVIDIGTLEQFAGEAGGDCCHNPTDN